MVTQGSTWPPSGRMEKITEQDPKSEYFRHLITLRKNAIVVNQTTYDDSTDSALA